MDDSVFWQGAYPIRMDWGPRGALDVGSRSTFAVVVDVLSFSTSVSVAVDRGIDVLPYRWQDESARAFAAEHDAELAVGRLEATKLPSNGTAVTLSPSSIASAQGIERLVLPSPNGSATAHALRDAGCTVLAGCLRNRGAVASWLAGQLSSDPSASVCIVAAGERWASDDTLRPCVEDLWGAGGIAHRLAQLFPAGVSPETVAAIAAFEAARPDLQNNLFEAAGGRELMAKGMSGDVEIAAQLDESEVVPVLRGRRFQPEASPENPLPSRA
jgi:2-phosphosulfolactate phosphatase